MYIYNQAHMESTSEIQKKVPPIYTELERPSFTKFYTSPPLVRLFIKCFG